MPESFSKLGSFDAVARLFLYRQVVLGDQVAQPRSQFLFTVPQTDPCKSVPVPPTA
ncbi:MAG: hypothetical protein RMZ43_015680 [Nostoc sp. CmiVER01]|uniref:hypothetical protein n=1 Tax=Nostoc sp. CmiVER01 TaxID=3075384 RepID=UPI002AD43B17|nr:hypothetical protein [Nostoc sp. CmiVER01]MDZ8122792.1 hypothetical protein [Nostoc sp. CmiVER01]